MPRTDLSVCEVALTALQEEKVNTIIGGLLARLLDEIPNMDINEDKVRDLQNVSDYLRPGVRFAVKHLRPA